MTYNLNLSEKDKLNRSNYETWKWKLENVHMNEKPRTIYREGYRHGS